MLALVLALLLLAVTAWVCLVLGTVELLAGALGRGPALLAVAVGLVLLAGLMAAAAAAVRRSSRPAAGVARRVLPGVLAEGARGALTRPLVLRVLLAGLGLVLLLAALLVPAPPPAGPKDPPS